MHRSPRARSAARSQASATLRPAGFSGTLAVSPLGGVTMRHRQSSVMTDTHCPVMSMNAPAAGAGRSRRVLLGARGCQAQGDRQRGKRHDGLPGPHGRGRRARHRRPRQAAVHRFDEAIRGPVGLPP